MVIKNKKEAAIIKKYFLDKKKSYKCVCGSKLQIRYLNAHYGSKKHILFIKNQIFFNKFGYYS